MTASALPAVGVWYNIGPSPIHDTTSPDAAGRVSTIAVDPSNDSHWLLGAAQGGIWESDDAGNSWIPRSDGRESLAMGDIAFAPSNPLIVYAGSGEGNFSADSYGGMGLLKSTDGGTTWTLEVSSPFEQTAFSRVKVNPADPNSLVVATVRGVQGEVQKGLDIPPTSPPRGIFVSTNGGATWTRTLTGEATDVAVSPATMNDQYAALGEIYGAAVNGLYRTRDGGAHWALINGPWTQAGGPNGMGRMRVVIAPSDMNRLYVSVASNRDPVNGTSLLGIWMTTRAWDSSPAWTLLSGGLPDPGPYPWYSQNLMVHPANPNVLYYAGIDVLRYDGSIWEDLPNQHPDQHTLAWRASSKSVIAAHDGGVSSRPDAGGNWTSHINGLAITQFYKGSVDPTGSQVTLGGNQDNGTVVNNGVPQWDVAYGGDGYSNAVASIFPIQWAVSHQIYGTETILRTQDGQNYVDASTGIDPSTIDFFIPFVMHPVNHDIFVAGSTNLWRTTSFFSGVPQWNANSPTLQTATHANAYITAMAFAPADAAGNIYAYGTEDGQLRLTINAGVSWTNINPAGTVPGRYVAALAFSPGNSNELYVTLSGFDAGTPGHPGHVFKTINALANMPVWDNISPPVDLPQDSIAIDPTNAQSVWVGSDIGLWNSPDGGKSWTHFGPVQGMPNVAVFDLQFDNVGTLTAFTHGRGAFRFRPISRLANVNLVLCTIECLFPWLDLESLVANPGDPVTFTLPLENLSPFPTRDLTATLVPSREVLPAGGSQVQRYGAMSVSTGIAVGNFSFTVALPSAVGGASSPATPGVASILPPRDPTEPEANEGDPDRSCPVPSTTEKANVTFALEDSGQSLRSFTLPFILGKLVAPLTQSFEVTAIPQLPEGWFSIPPDSWVTSSSPPRNVLVAGAPDLPTDPPQSTRGPVTISAFAASPESHRPSDLYSSVFQVMTENATLKFRHSFDFNPNTLAVLEISIGGKAFEDILKSGGSFAQNGYNTPAEPRQGVSDESREDRPAWSGNSRGYLISKVNLPKRAAGQAVQLRWRLGGEGAAAAGEGWYVNDLVVKEYPLTSLRQPCTN